MQRLLLRGEFQAIEADRLIGILLLRNAERIKLGLHEDLRLRDFISPGRKRGIPAFRLFRDILLRRLLSERRQLKRVALFNAESFC